MKILNNGLLSIELHIYIQQLPLSGMQLYLNLVEVVQKSPLFALRIIWT